MLENKIGYKVVIRGMKSLGLRNNKNILKYPLRKWYFLSSNKIKKGKEDYGGIWLCKSKRGARKYL